MKIAEVTFLDGSVQWFQAPLGVKERERLFVIKLPGAVHIFPFEGVRSVCEREKAESRA